MLGAGIVLCGLYFVLVVIEEVRFHRKRPMTRKEHLGHVANVASVAACFALVDFVKFEPPAKLVYGLLLIASMFLWAKDELVHAGRSSAREQWVRAWIYMLHPLVIIYGIIMWPFVNGAGFFMGMVLPFKTDGLKQLGFAMAGAFALLAVFELAFWKLKGATEPLP